MQNGHTILRSIFFTAAVAPLFTLAACDLLKHGDATVDASAAVATATAETPAATTAAAATTTAPLAPVQTAANTKPVAVKLPDGGTGAKVTLTDGGTAILPSAGDGGVPGLPGFTIPTALPSGMAIPTTMPSTIPTTLPSGIPTTLPSGFHLPAFPTASATH